MKSFFFSPSNFGFTAKVRGKNRDFQYASCPYIVIASQIANMPNQNGSFVTTTELTLTCHNHPKSVDFMIAIINSVSLKKCVMTGIYYYSIIQSIFMP